MRNVLIFRYLNEARLFLSYFEVHCLETLCLYWLLHKGSEQVHNIALNRQFPAIQVKWHHWAYSFRDKNWQQSKLCKTEGLRLINCGFRSKWSRLLSDQLRKFCCSTDSATVLQFSITLWRLNRFLEKELLERRAFNQVSVTSTTRQNCRRGFHTVKQVWH